MRNRSHLTSVICLALAIALASGAFVACGGDLDTPQQPAAAPAPTDAAAPTLPAAPTPPAAAAPTSTLAPVPTAAAATPTPRPRPVLTVSAGPAVETGLSADCLPGGVLEDVATISSCAEQAMGRVKSFSFDGEFNLLALFPVEDDDSAAGLLTLSGAVVLPDRTRFEISFSPEGEMVRMAGVVIGRDTYVRDPESGMWFKGDPSDADFLGVVPMVGLLQLPRDSDATLSDSISLEDGTTGYVLSYGQTGSQSGMEGLVFPGRRLVVVVGADDFLTREARIALEDVNAGAPDLLTFRYHGYNETQEIEPPAEYATLPGGPMGSGAPGLPTVAGLARNGAGDVEVTFSRPVHVQGQVELYVIDPATGGWTLPLLGGSGTAILTFDADAEDRPSLVAGVSQIPGFIFPTPDSWMTGGGGSRLDLTFDQWTYP